MRAKYFFNGLGFGNVAKRGRRTVYVYIIQLIGFHTGIAKGVFH